jgi:toxin-antitoxin system PIN domain toxin
MMTPDVNVLLAALRDDHPHHELARSWLLAALTAAESGQSLVVLPMVAAGVLRVATHPKVFEPPTPLPVVLDFLDKLLSSPGVEYGELGREWPALRRMVRQHAACGNSVPDAWIPSAAQTLGALLVTFDKGFKRYLSASELTILTASVKT